MKPGDRVELVGLEARAEMNGLQGVLIRENAERPDRWEVLLENETKRRVMKCCNLALLQTDVTETKPESHTAPAKFEDRMKTEALTSGVSRERFKAFSNRVKGFTERDDCSDVLNKLNLVPDLRPQDHKSNAERDSRSELNFISEPDAEKENRSNAREKPNLFPNRISLSAEEAASREDVVDENAAAVASNGSKGAREDAVLNLPDLPAMQQLNAEVEKLSAEVRAKEEAIRKADKERRAAESARQAAEAARRSAEELLAATMKAKEEELSIATMKAESTKIAAHGREGESLEGRLQRLDEIVAKQSKMLNDLERKFSERFEEKVDAALEAAEIVTEQQSKLSDMFRSLDEGFSERIEALEEKLAIIHQGRGLPDSGYFRSERYDTSSSSMVTKEISKLACKIDVFEQSLVRTGVLSVAVEAEIHRKQFKLLCASSNWSPSADFAAVFAESKVFGELAKLCCMEENLALRAVSTISREEKQGMLQRAAEESIKRFLDSSDHDSEDSASFLAAPRCEVVQLINDNARDVGLLGRLQKWLRQAALWQLDQCQDCSSSEAASFLEAELQKFQVLLVISAKEYADGKEALRKMKERKDAAEELRAAAERKLRAASAWATSKDTTKLEQAIKDAKDAGVDSVDVIRAEKFLQTLRPGRAPISRPTRRSSQPPKRTSPKSLYGFLQETMPSWPQYSLASAIDKLEKISITTVAELRDALHAEGDLHLTNRLRDAKQKVFKVDTLESLVAGCGEFNE